MMGTISTRGMTVFKSRPGALTRAARSRRPFRP
jgi:hypothetical protein